MKLPKGKPHKIDWEKAKELGKKILEDEKEPEPSEIIYRLAEKNMNKRCDYFDEKYYEEGLDKTAERTIAITDKVDAILEYLDTKDS